MCYCDGRFSCSFLKPQPRDTAMSDTIKKPLDPSVVRINLKFESIRKKAESHLQESATPQATFQEVGRCSRLLSIIYRVEIPPTTMEEPKWIQYVIALDLGVAKTAIAASGDMAHKAAGLPFRAFRHEGSKIVLILGDDGEKHEITVCLDEQMRPYEES